MDQTTIKEIGLNGIENNLPRAETHLKGILEINVDQFINNIKERINGCEKLIVDTNFCQICSKEVIGYLILKEDSPKEKLERVLQKSFHYAFGINKIFEEIETYSTETIVKELSNMRIAYKRLIEDCETELNKKYSNKKMSGCEKNQLISLIKQKLREINELNSRTITSINIEEGRYNPFVKEILSYVFRNEFLQNKEKELVTRFIDDSLSKKVGIASRSSKINGLLKKIKDHEYVLRENKIDLIKERTTDPLYLVTAIAYPLNIN